MNLTEAIQTFLEDQGSANTARTYDCGLRRFLAWNPVQTIEELDPKRVIPFARSLKREGLSPRSIAAYITAVIQLLRWIKREQVADVSAEDLLVLQEQVKDWNRKNTIQPLPRLPKEEAVVSVLEVAHGLDTDDQRLHLYHLRNRALVETLASTGCRVSEAANLKRADLVPDQMAAWVRQAKGRKDRLIIFDSEDSWNVVQEYLAERDTLHYVSNDEPLFSAHDKRSHGRGELNALSTNAMRSALNALEEKANADHFTPHQLRHRAGTELLRKTGNLEIVRRFLGHADIGTTSRTYMHLSNQDLIEAVRGG